MKVFLGIKRGGYMMKEILDKFKYGEFIKSINESDYLEFKEVNDVEEWGKNHYFKWSEEYKNNMNIMKEAMREAKEGVENFRSTYVIEGYCGYDNRKINDYLRYNIDDKDKLGREMATILGILLTMAPRVPENIIVYRLVCDNFVKELIENNKIGKPTVDRGFISTSLLKEIVNLDEAYSGHNNLLKIYVPKNTVGIYVNGIEKREEQELLLFPNGWFRLIKSPYIDCNKKVYECEIFYFNHYLF